MNDYLLLSSPLISILFPMWIVYIYTHGRAVLKLPCGVKNIDRWLRGENFSNEKCKNSYSRLCGYNRKACNGVYKLSGQSLFSTPTKAEIPRKSTLFRETQTPATEHCIRHWLLEIKATPTKHGSSSSYISNTYCQAEKATCLMNNEEGPEMQL